MIALVHRLLLVAASVTGSTTTLAADAFRETPLWPDGSTTLQQGIDLLAGQPNAITHPSMLVYPARAPSARSAVLVFPGGGFKAVAIGPQSTLGKDGADVCRWLTDAGVTCVLVKYRVPNTGCNWNPVMRRHDAPAIPMALQDAQRAMSIVRHRAREFGIDARRVGVLGFSAGGNLAVLSSTEFERRAYAPVDAADREPLRPDFAIPVYPGHLTMEHKNQVPRAVAAQRLNTDVHVSAKVPPTFLVHAKDDPVDPVHYSLVYARELRKAGVDVTLSLYEHGGHAFGVKRQGTDSDRWMPDAMTWLARLGMLRPDPARP